MSTVSRHVAPGLASSYDSRAAGGPIRFVRANALIPFVGFIESVGARVDGLLDQARVPGALLGDPESLVPLFSAYRFVEAAARREKIEDLGIVVAQRACAFDLGAYGSALQEASTVYEYIRTGVQLIGGHSSGTRLWLSEEGDALRIHQHLTGPACLGRCIGDLFTLVITMTTLRRIVGSHWHPAEVRLMAGDEKLLGDSRILGDAVLVTGQPHTSFTISRDLMRLPLPDWRPRSQLDSDAQPSSNRAIPTDFRVSAEQLIETLLVDGYPDIQTAAEAAGMRPRTLQRRLADSGVSYSELVAGCRLRLAKAWLVASDMPVAEIAATLGYSEASNFARAFRRQTGLSPAAFRRGAKRD
jgi:AraC-like DNA-binding protein